MQQLKSILESREATYRVLGRLFQEEVTSKLLPDLKALHFPEDTKDAAFNRASARFNAFVAKLTPEALDDLAADYARTFLSAGVAEGPSAFPFESVYTSREHLIMQNAYEEVLVLLRKHGMAPSKPDLYADQIGIELEFMGFLSHKALEAIDARDQPAAEAGLEEAETFLKHHLLNWTEKFFADLKKVARTDFYPALADLTHHWLEEDRRWFAGE